MNTFMRRIGIAAVGLALLGQSCRTEDLTPAPTPAPAPPVASTTVEAPNPSAETSSTADSTYTPFTQTAYNEARAQNAPIFLFFYANFCPTCKEQDPRNQHILPTIGGDLRGFRVNFNDSETDADERALAKEFGVTYQHTAFFLDRNGKLLKKVIGTQSNEALTQDLRALIQ